MKRRKCILTLGFAALSLGLLILAFWSAATVALSGAAICWAAGFAWFVKFGRRAKGWRRYLFAAAFWVLCAVLVGCAAWCVWYMIKG